MSTWGPLIFTALTTLVFLVLQERFARGSSVARARADLLGDLELLAKTRAAGLEGSPVEVALRARVGGELAAHVASRDVDAFGSPAVTRRERTDRALLGVVVFGIPLVGLSTGLWILLDDDENTVLNAWPPVLAVFLLMLVTACVTVVRDVPRLRVILARRRAERRSGT